MKKTTFRSLPKTFRKAKKQEGDLTKIAAYCRVSTEHESQLDSLENQKTFFENYAQKNGHELVGLYTDEGISGRQTKKRAGFLRMLSDAKEKKFELVIVKDISRFARNTVDFLNSVRFLRSIGVDVLFLSGNQSVLGDSEFILTIFGALAQEESANLSNRVKFGKKLSAEKGRVPNLIYGYDRINLFTLEKNPSEAETVRRIFHLYDFFGLGCRRIADTLNAEAIPSKNGYSWNAKTVRRILTNPIYCGKLVNRKFEVADFLSGKVSPLPESENLTHERPELAIVSEKDFCDAGKILEKRREKFSDGKRYSAVNVFSTLIRCTECSRAFIKRRYPSGKEVWRCSGRDRNHCRNFTLIDNDLLLRALRKHFSKCENLSDILYAAAKKASFSPCENKNRERSERLIARAKTMFENDIISIDELISRIKTAKRLYPDSAPESTPFNAADAVEKFLSLESVNAVQMQHIIEKITVSPDGKTVIFIKKHD